MKDTHKEKIDNVAGAGASDKMEGNAKKVAGKMEETAGKLTGNDRLRAKGVAKQVEGSAEHAFGEVKKGVDDLLNKGKKAMRKH